MQAQVDAVQRKTVISDKFYKKLENPAGRQFETNCALSVLLTAQYNLKMRSMIRKVMGQIAKIDENKTWLNEWGQHVNKDFKSKEGFDVYESSEKECHIKEDGAERLLDKIMGGDISLFFNFHHYVSNKLYKNPSSANVKMQFTRAWIDTYHNDIVPMRGNRHSLPRIAPFNDGGLNMRDGTKQPKRFRINWQNQLSRLTYKVHMFSWPPSRKSHKVAVLQGDQISIFGAKLLLRMHI